MCCTSRFESGESLFYLVGGIILDLSTYQSGGGESKQVASLPTP